MKKKNKKILIVIGFLMAIIALLQSVLYYYGKFWENGTIIKFLGLLFMCLKSTLNSFFFNPSLSPGDVYAFITSEAFTGNKDIYFFVAMLYSIVVALAPLFTVYVTVSYFFKHFLWYIIDKYFNRKKSRIYVFGLNKNVKSIIKKDFNYIVYCSSDTNNEIISEVSARNVHIHPFDFDDNDSKFDSIVHQIIKTKSKVFFMEESDLKNFQLFNALDQKIGNNRTIDMYLLCEKDSMKKAIIDYSDSYEKNRNLHVFNSDDLKVNCIMQYEPVCNHIQCDDDFHAIIIGFSKYGQNLFRHLVNDAVYSSDNTISVDIFDYNIEKHRKEFYSSLNEDCVKLENDSMYVVNHISDGNLMVRFHNMDINHYPFKETLKELDGKIDIAYVCIDDEDKCMDVLLQLKDTIITYNIPKFPVIASITDGNNLMTLLSNYKEFKKDKIEELSFHLVESKKYFNLDTILKEEYEKNARDFNKLYNSLNIVTTDQPDSYTAKEWELLPNFKKYSNYLAVSHQNTMKKIFYEKYKFDYKGMNDSIERELGLQNVSKDGKFIYSFNGTNNELVDRINQISFIKEVCSIEHRRWCYERIFTGWKYSKDKMDSRRVTPCLTDWETLCRDNREYCKYDLMPLLFEFIKD